MFARLFDKYTGWLRGLKALYVVNNLLHARQLKRNERLYRQFGLHKSIFSPIGSKDFATANTREKPWLDAPDALQKMEAHPDFATFTPEIQQQLRQYITDGYMVLPGFISLETVENMNREVEQLLASKKANFNYTGRKIINLYENSELANRAFFRNDNLLRIFSFIFQKEIVPFHSINFLYGSEQKAHSDSIHMMTEPKGYLGAAWFALEPCTSENGPVFYYPGSHRLDYLTTEHYNSGNTWLTVGQDSNARYEAALAKVLEKQSFEKRYFLANPGDLLIWHANLIHGGSAIKQPGATRKSMVCHYFCEDVICYHEISQRPALFPEKN